MSETKQRSAYDKQDYFPLSDIVKQEIKEHRENSWNKLIEHLDTKDNSLWQITGKLLNKSKRSQHSSITGLNFMMKSRKQTFYKTHTRISSQGTMKKETLRNMESVI